MIPLRHGWLTFVLALLPAPVLSAAPRESDAERIREMFARLDLQTPGLEHVKQALDRDDLSAAEAAYFEYWKSRKGPVFVWGAVYSDGDLKFRSAQYDFFEPRRLVFSWRDRDTAAKHIYRGKGWDFAAKRQLYTVMELADMMLENKCFHPWWPQIPPQEMGDPWDWSKRPQNDGSWTCHLNRQEFYLALGQAYWLTGDERYAKKLLELWTGWIRDSDHICYGALGPMCWVYIYNEALRFIVSSPSLTAHDFCTIQAWLATDNIDRLIADPRGFNQLMGSACAMVYTGVLMPEFKDAPAWIEEGDRRLIRFLNEAAYTDGALAEATFHYQWGSVTEFMYAWALAEKNGVELKAVSRDRMRKIAEYFVYTARPDWQWPWTGDGARGSACNLVEKIARLFPAEEAAEMRYFATHGHQGKQPTKSSAWFAYPGLCVMRDRYTPEANYLYFDVGPTGIGHRHADKLSIEVSAFGRSLLEDLGIHTYAGDPKEWPQQTLAASSRGHNTVVVDGKSQTIPSELGRAPLDNPWMSTDVLDFNAGRYAGPYVNVGNNRDLGGGEIRNVTHHRSVAFIKPDYWIVTDRLLPRPGPQPPDVPVLAESFESGFKNGGEKAHEYEQLFHFVPVKLKQDPKTLAVWSTTPGTPNLVLVPVLDAGLSLEIAEGRQQPYLQGWYYQDTGPRVVPAPCVIYRRREKPPAIIQTVLYPLRPGQSTPPTAERIGDPQDGALKVTLPDGRVDLYRSTSERCHFELGGVPFYALAALVRLDAQGHVAAKAAVEPGADGQTTEESK